MATINFTAAPSTTLSSASAGYFPLFSGFLGYFTYGYFSGDLYTTATGDPDYYDNQLNTAAYKFKTTDGTRTLASYFNTSALIGVATTWNFSANSEYITLEPFSLYSYNATTFATTWLGIHSFENDIINLGAGTDFFDMYLEFYANYYASTTYVELSDQVLDGGYKVTVNGGAGNDNIAIEWMSDGESDYVVNKKGTSATTTVIPVAIINGDGGNDQISVYGMAAIVSGDTPGSTANTGADVIETSFFSDRIIGGPSADVINGCTDYYDISGPVTFSQALNQKDIFSGGTGRDTFLIGFNNAYGLNGGNDFALITDFETTDRIASVFYRGDLLIDGTDGSIALATTSAYTGATYNYTARVFLDSDDSKTVTAADELLLIVCGAQPTAANFVYGV